jgi:hypothetical protein
MASAAFFRVYEHTALARSFLGEKEKGHGSQRPLLPILIEEKDIISQVVLHRGGEG